MKPDQAVSDLRYGGKALGFRQPDHIFRCRRHSLVLSFKRDDPRGGNFNIIDCAVVSYAEAKFHVSNGIAVK
jgi:hypothetical protein